MSEEWDGEAERLEKRYGYYGKMTLKAGVPHIHWKGPMSRAAMMQRWPEYRHNFRPTEVNEHPESGGLA